MPPSKKTPPSPTSATLHAFKKSGSEALVVKHKQGYLFREKLKTPGYLSQLDIARIRKIIGEATEEEFEEYMSCSVEGAKRILSFWEIAQIELWDAEILKRFFHEWIYADRGLVASRIEAATYAGRLPERFAPEVGLQWLESENVLIGMAGHWVTANHRKRKSPLSASALALSDDSAADAVQSRTRGAEWSKSDLEKLLDDFEATKGNTKRAKYEALATARGLKWQTIKKYVDKAAKKSAQPAQINSVFRSK